MPQRRAFQGPQMEKPGQSNTGRQASPPNLAPAPEPIPPSPSPVTGSPLPAMGGGMGGGMPGAGAGASPAGTNGPMGAPPSASMPAPAPGPQPQPPGGGTGTLNPLNIGQFLGGATRRPMGGSMGGGNTGMNQSLPPTDDYGDGGNGDTAEMNPNDPGSLMLRVMKQVGRI